MDGSSTSISYGGPAGDIRARHATRCARSVIAIVGAPVIVEAYAPEVAVLMTRQLTAHLASMPAAVLSPADVQAVYGLARHRAVWTRTIP